MPNCRHWHSLKGRQTLVVMEQILKDFIYGFLGRPDVTSPVGWINETKQQRHHYVDIHEFILDIDVF